MLLSSPGLCLQTRAKGSSCYRLHWQGGGQRCSLLGLPLCMDRQCRGPLSRPELEVTASCCVHSCNDSMLAVGLISCLHDELACRGQRPTCCKAVACLQSRKPASASSLGQDAGGTSAMVQSLHVSSSHCIWVQAVVGCVNNITPACDSIHAGAIYITIPECGFVCGARALLNTVATKAAMQTCSADHAGRYASSCHRDRPDTGSTITAALHTCPAAEFCQACSHARVIHLWASLSSDPDAAAAAAVAAAVTAVASGTRHVMGHCWDHSSHCARVAGAWAGTCRHEAAAS